MSGPRDAKSRLHRSVITGELDMVPKPVIAWIEENEFGSISSVHPLGGGCINDGVRLETTSGGSFFLKTNSRAPEDMFAREAEGLQAMNLHDAPRVPRPYFYDEDFLLMEDLAPAPRRADYWEEFGRQLAALHKYTHNQFGFQHDNYIGSTPQPNPWTDDGYVFFTEQRLKFQSQLALKRGLLGRRELEQVERLAARLPDLIPSQPASLIHGDLWTGNAMTDSNGGPAIIDPAAHYGWAEAELAMTTLFGSFPEVFYRAYQEISPLEEGLRDRFPLYNLYHLLNHLNLFGSGYLGQVKGILSRFS
jgi:fructosamine-3-kinase